jgi:hypothetical protein
MLLHAPGTSKIFTLFLVSLSSMVTRCTIKCLCTSVRYVDYGHSSCLQDTPWCDLICTPILALCSAVVTSLSEVRVIPKEKVGSQLETN